MVHQCLDGEKNISKVKVEKKRCLLNIFIIIIIIMIMIMTKMRIIMKTLANSIRSLNLLELDRK